MSLFYVGVKPFSPLGEFIEASVARVLTIRGPYGRTKKRAFFDLLCVESPGLIAHSDSRDRVAHPTRPVSWPAFSELHPGRHRRRFCTSSRNA